MNFALPTGFLAGTQDPATGSILSWNALEVPVTSGAVGSVWRMNTGDAAAPGDFHEALSSINGVARPIGYPAVAPTQWNVEARLTNLLGATKVCTAYNVTGGAGDYDSMHLSAGIQAVLFTGDYGGTHYEDALALSSSVTVAGSRWESCLTDFLLPNLVPGAQDLSLRMEVSNGGQTFASFQRLGNAAAWSPAQTHTLPAGLGVLTGFDSNNPYVPIENSIPVPELPACAALLLGLDLQKWRARPRRALPLDSRHSSSTLAVPVPSVCVEVRRSYSPEEETALLLAVHEALVSAFRISPVHRNLTLVVHPPQRFLGRTDCPEPDRLTNVTLYVLPGRSVEAKRRLYRGIVQRLEALGIPPACTLIRLVELPHQNFGVRGGQAACDVDLGYPLNV